MKNTLPLVLAVLLGLAAVFAVHRNTATRAAGDAKVFSVLVAARDLPKGRVPAEGDFRRQDIPASAYIHDQHILFEEKDRLDAPLSRAVKQGQLLLSDDFSKNSLSLSESVGPGELMLPVKFKDSSLLADLRPGDEIAIAALQHFSETDGTENLNEKPRVRSVSRFTILFPRVTVTEVRGSHVLVSLAPEPAMRLLAASQTLPLYPLLRNADDDDRNLSVELGGSVSLGDLSPAAIAAALVGSGDAEPAPGN